MSDPGQTGPCANELLTEMEHNKEEEEEKFLLGPLELSTLVLHPAGKDHLTKQACSIKIVGDKLLAFSSGSNMRIRSTGDQAFLF